MTQDEIEELNQQFVQWRQANPAASMREAYFAGAPKWLPIETAPKEGTYVLLGSAESGGSWIGVYRPEYESGWRPENPWASMMLNLDHLPKRYPHLIPTHWMPLPPAPGVAPPVASQAVEVPSLSQIAGDLWDASMNCDYEAFKGVVATYLPTLAKGA